MMNTLMISVGVYSPDKIWFVQCGALINRDTSVTTRSLWEY